MDTLVLKLTLTPLLIASASMAQRRWGGVIGGLVAGLPLTSAPVSAFLAVDHGPEFAAHAATGTLLGVPAMSAFCFAYAKASARRSWRTSAWVALSVCAALTVLASQVPQTLVAASLVTFPALVALIVAIGRPAATSEAPTAPPRWDMPARMVVATALVLAITGAASALGPKWSGLLSTLPVYALVMGAFTHAHGGHAAAHAFLRGVAVGAIGSATFLVAVVALVEHASLLVTYSVAVLASVGGAALSQASFDAPRFGRRRAGR